MAKRKHYQLSEWEDLGLSGGVDRLMAGVRAARYSDGWYLELGGDLLGRVCPELDKPRVRRLGPYTRRGLIRGAVFWLSLSTFRVLHLRRSELLAMVDAVARRR